jgi:hypothetical protein
MRAVDRCRTNDAVPLLANPWRQRQLRDLSRGAAPLEFRSLVSLGLDPDEDAAFAEDRSGVGRDDSAGGALACFLQRLPRP